MYSGLYGFFNTFEATNDGSPLQLTNDITQANTFYLDSSNFLDSSDNTAFQSSEDGDELYGDALLFGTKSLVAGTLASSEFVRPTCSISFTNEVTCTEAGNPGDSRTTFSVCPFDLSNNFTPDPYIKLGNGIERGCSEVPVFLIPVPSP